MILTLRRAKSHSPIKDVQSTTTLFILINARLNFQPHVEARTDKAERLLATMLRLGKTNGGLALSSLRAKLTSAIKPILTWGAEIWHRYDKLLNLSYNPSSQRSRLLGRLDHYASETRPFAAS